MFNEPDTPPFRLLLPACEIPDGSTVTKRTGENEYTLTREVTFHQVAIPGADRKVVIKAPDGAVFLNGARGSVNAHTAETLLLWVVHEDELLRWLEDRAEGTPQ